jgi:hypothetical protein
MYVATTLGGGDEVEPHSLKNFFNTCTCIMHASIEKNSQYKIGKSNALNGAHESSYTEGPSLNTYACNDSMDYVKYETIIHHCFVLSFLESIRVLLQAIGKAKKPEKKCWSKKLETFGKSACASSWLSTFSTLNLHKKFKFLPLHICI